MMLPMFGLHAPEAVHVVGGGLAGAHLYGHLVWLSVSGEIPTALAGIIF